MKKILLFALLITLKASAQNVHVLYNDYNHMQQIMKWIPAIGYKASADTIAHYGYENLDSMPNELTNATGSYFAYKYGGWLTNFGSGGYVQTTIPHGVLLGNSLAGGHPWRTSALEQNNYGISDSAGQICYYLTRATNMPWYDMGIGGQTTSQIRARFRREVLGISDIVGDSKNAPTALGKASVCIIEGEVNDPFNAVPYWQTIANVRWMAQQCAEYEIPCIILNGVGQGISASFPTLASVQPYLNQIAAFNTWCASNDPQKYGAIVIDENSFWNSGVDGGTSAYHNDNFHFSSFVTGAGVHYSQVGYDSIAQIILRHGNLPILDSIMIVSVTDPSNPPSSFTQMTAFTISGVANFGTGTQSYSQSYTIPGSTPIATVALTGPILTDTPRLTITTPSSGVSGAANIYYHLSNNPNHLAWTTNSKSFVGESSGWKDIDSLTITVMNYALAQYPLVVRGTANSGYDHFLDLQANTVAGSLFINGLTFPPTNYGAGGIINACSASSSVFGFSTPAAISAAGTGPGGNGNVLGSIYVGGTTNAAGVYALNIVSGKGFAWQLNSGSYGNTANNQSAMTIENIQEATIGYQPNVMGAGLVIRMGTSTNNSTNSTYRGTYFNPVDSDFNAVGSGKIWEGVAIIPRIVSATNTTVRALHVDSGDVVFNDHTGNIIIGSGTGIPSSKLSVVSTTQGSIPAPIMTTTQFGAISSPLAGIHAILSDSSNRLAVYNGSKIVTYATTDMLGGASTPTFQQVLTAGSTMTGNNTVAIGSHTFGFTGSGAISVANPSVFSGNLENGNFLSDTTTATEAFGAGAGSSPSFGSTNGAGAFAGKVDIVTGTLPSASSALVTITMNSVTYGDGGFTPVILSPANAAAAALSGTGLVWADAGNSAITLHAGAVALSASTEYKWNYIIVAHN